MVSRPSLPLLRRTLRSAQTLPALIWLSPFSLLSPKPPTAQPDAHHGHGGSPSSFLLALSSAGEVTLSAFIISVVIFCACLPSPGLFTPHPRHKGFGVSRPGRWRPSPCLPLSRPPPRASLCPPPRRTPGRCPSASFQCP